MRVFLSHDPHIVLHERPMLSVMTDDIGGRKEIKNPSQLTGNLSEQKKEIAERVIQHILQTEAHPSLFIVLFADKDNRGSYVVPPQCFKRGHGNRWHLCCEDRHSQGGIAIGFLSWGYLEHLHSPAEITDMLGQMVGHASRMAQIELEEAEAKVDALKKIYLAANGPK